MKEEIIAKFILEYINSDDNKEDRDTWTDEDTAKDMAKYICQKMDEQKKTDVKRIAPQFQVMPHIQKGNASLAVKNKVLVGATTTLEHYKNLVDRMELDGMFEIKVLGIRLLLFKCSQFDWQADYGKKFTIEKIKKEIIDQPKIIIPGR